MVILAGLILATLPNPAVAAAGPEQRVETLQRILVLGASLSHGYGLERDGGGRTTLGEIVEASLLAPHEPVVAKTSLVFFTAPLSTARLQIESAERARPTLVVGVDFLFWFGYGVFATDEGRLDLFDQGLHLLETFSCPVLVGDLPDVRDAARAPPSEALPAGRGGLLAPEQVPDAAMLRKLNGRLRAWAREHPNVVVLPLSDLVDRLHAGKAVEIRGNRWSGEALAGLLSADRLHPTLDGAVAIWLGALDSLVARRTDVPASTFEWDARAIEQRLQRLPKAPAK